jgi:hypothetical protein
VMCYKKDGSEIYFCNSSPISIVVYKRKWFYVLNCILFIYLPY